MKTSTIILRVVATGLGLWIAGWALWLFKHGAGVPASALMLVDGLMILVGVVFERRRYRPRVDLTKGDWQTTQEKFQDPVTGKTTTVLFNTKTGERSYTDSSD